MQQEKIKLDPTVVKEKLKATCKRTAPLWPLDSFVAVNPYMGLAQEPFDKSMHSLNALAGIKSTLAMEHYWNAMDTGALSSGDISEVLLATGNNTTTQNLYDFLEDFAQYTVDQREPKIKTFAETAGKQDGNGWQEFVVDRRSHWAAAHFDRHQAMWKTAQSHIGLFKAWKIEASIDLAPEVMGLKGFRKMVRELPDDHLKVASMALDELDITEELLETYLQALSLRMPGWSGYVAKRDWEDNLNGQTGTFREEFLAVQLAWEMCLKRTLAHQAHDKEWIAQLHSMETFVRQGDNDEALDRAHQRQLIEQINTTTNKTKKMEPRVQALFCIDVRSETFRRKLEATDSGIETLGFAGFFAFPIHYEPLGYLNGSDQCPVLLSPTHRIRESLGNPKEDQKVIAKRQLQRQVSKAWKSFKLGAISCFSFVGPVGLAYLPKLILDSLGLSRPIPSQIHRGLSTVQSQARTIALDIEITYGKTYGIPLQQRIKMAESALRAMSLAENFARIVLLTGHGSSTVNNPHASGLDCGACGGHTGEANAKVSAAVLNDLEVREGLRPLGIHVPSSTLFLAALHDTTTDKVEIFGRDNVPQSHQEDLMELESSLKLAGASCRKERALRMGIDTGDIDKKIADRSRDWSQIRPEWGLAGCSSFIVAPRERTAHLDLRGKAFMHSYDWRKDTDFGILELIMTAPMVVTSWINLQYYASTVDNATYGSGNKTLHNVVGGIGVLEGYSGDLRCGLPWQSVHDGKSYQHLPQRLNVMIEAPIDEISKILGRNEHIRNLCDNRWIFLFGINNEGRVAYRYTGDLQWETV